MVIHERMWTKVNDPKLTFDPIFVEVTWMTLLKDHFIQVPWKYVILKYVDTVTFFFQKLEPKVIDP